MRKFIFWTIVVLAGMMLVSLSATGLQVRAHARPLPYPPTFFENSVEYAQMETGLFATTKLYNTSPRGVHSIQKLGTSRTNVKTTCPKNDHTQLMWSVAGGSRVHVLDPGECLLLQDRTAYVIVVLDAR